MTTTPVHQCTAWDSPKPSIARELRMGVEKEKRLLLVAQKAGALEAKAMSEGNRDRAYHFMRRMYRLLRVVASMRNERESSRG